MGQAPEDRPYPRLHDNQPDSGEHRGRYSSLGDLHRAIAEQYDQWDLASSVDERHAPTQKLIAYPTNEDEEAIVASIIKGRETLVYVTIRPEYLGRKRWAPYYRALKNDDATDEIEAAETREQARRYADVYLRGYQEGYDDGYESAKAEHAAGNRADDRTTGSGHHGQPAPAQGDGQDRIDDERDAEGDRLGR